MEGVTELAGEGLIELEGTRVDIEELLDGTGETPELEGRATRAAGGVLPG